MDPPRLAVLIVNWNGGELLRACLRSLLANPPATLHELIVVDNASSDGSLEWVSALTVPGAGPLTGLRTIANAENLGFSRANNLGLAATCAPFVLLLNPDTEVTAGSVDALVRRLESTPAAAACGPRLLNSDGSLQASVWRNPATPWEILVIGLRLYKLLPRRLRGELLLGPFWAHDRRRDVRMLSGAALLVRRDAWLGVGGLDERFHMYGEDVDFCLRLARAGWRLVFEPAATVVHHGGTSALRRWDAGTKLRVQSEAFLRFEERSLTRLHLVANRVAALLVLAPEWLWRAVRGRPRADVVVLAVLNWTYLARALARGASAAVRDEAQQ